MHRSIIRSMSELICWTFAKTYNLVSLWLSRRNMRCSPPFPYPLSQSCHCSSPSEQSKGSQARPVAPQQKCFFSSVLLDAQIKGPETCVQIESIRLFQQTQAEDSSVKGTLIIYMVSLLLLVWNLKVWQHKASASYPRCNECAAVPKVSRQAPNVGSSDRSCALANLESK